MTAIDSVGALIELHEGRRRECYDDAHPNRVLKAGDRCEGTPTIGVGCTGPGIVPGLVWTDAQIDAAKAERMALAVRQASSDLGLGFGGWSALDPVRQAVLVDMAYNLGGVGLARFRKMLAAIVLADWQKAHDELLASKLATQAPSRAVRLAGMLITGSWPTA